MAANDDPRPLAGLINEAKEGRLTVSFNADVRLNAEEFAYMERDCQAFKDAIRSLQQIAMSISKQSKWGLGEDQKLLTSAQILVHRFRAKAAIVDPATDSENNIFDILEEHYKAVDNIQELHRTIAQKFMETDQDFAARYNEVQASMPKSQITAPVQGPGVQTDEKWK
ncbi:hypothetical protein [Nocardia blacklockiae]|uniref:hypothetical protein n=1 Tax=Nocardia blacklockiae TaxID=480036 RepID=UPI001894A06C|nr:hypothetical protein [Nocardia blacklockiae]MBF6172610.1 hypothetical protein [Nocardia blacklockiae]